MAQPLSSFLVMTRPGDGQALALGHEVADWVSGRGAQASLCEHSAGRGLEACQAPEGRPWDCVLVLGGDGTFIGVARGALARGLPILGLNLGRVGFLAEGAHTWQERVTALMSGEYQISERLCLAYEVRRQGTLAASGSAVNDVVVSRGELARLVRLKVRRGGLHVASLRADGLIVSTPTGSTAYGFSAGGPLVYPEMQVFCLTPVCPFLNTFRPMLLPPDQPLGIEAEEPGGGVRLSVDGQLSFALEPGDEVRIARHPEPLRMAVTARSSYFDKLASKGFFTER